MALFLFLGTALVVVWQNSRLAVLWDLSYVLEYSYRMSLGDIPYRDFPFPHAPLTFLIQAALIKLAGRVFWHTTVYCAIVGGLATVLTWRILFNLLRKGTTYAWLLAFLLSLPVIPLGIYCIVPHPFYDPDCIFTVLLVVFLLQQLERKPSSSVRAFLTGATLVIPLFVKQNIGLPFLACVVVGLAILIAIGLWQRDSVRAQALALTGALVGLALALLLIHLTAGLKNYWYWTIQFAASRRTPARAEMLGIYEDKELLFWLTLIAVGTIVLWLSRRGSRALTLFSAFLIAAPFVWPMIYLAWGQDADERADQLLAVWPVLLIVSFVSAVATTKRRKGVALVLPFILIGTVHGAFLSQQLWGSTYAIWPLLMILLASAIIDLSMLAKAHPNWIAIPICSLIALSLLVSGAFYVWLHERLNYANLEDGEMARSTLPQLKGLATRGHWIPDFEELVRYSEREIPREDGLLLIPGEDPFYYTTGRHPGFPVLLFNSTTNPYTLEEIVKLCRVKNIRWLIIKQDLQLEEDPVEDKDRLIELLERDYEQVESLNDYDIYRRNESASDREGN